MSELHVTDAELDQLRQLGASATPAPWRAMVEGRDHSSGDSFIMIGRDDDRDEDMYVSRDSGPASASDLDFIAAARNYLPRLIDEIVELRRQCEKLPPLDPGVPRPYPGRALRAPGATPTPHGPNVR